MIYLLFVFVAVISYAKKKYHGQKIIGYVASYNLSHHIDYSKLTHAIFTFPCPKKDGTLMSLYNHNYMNIIEGR